MERTNETLTKEIKELKKNLAEKNNAVNEIRNSLDAMNIRLAIEEE